MLPVDYRHVFTQTVWVLQLSGKARSTSHQVEQSCTCRRSGSRQNESILSVQCTQPWKVAHTCQQGIRNTHNDSNCSTWETLQPTVSVAAQHVMLDACGSVEVTIIAAVVNSKLLEQHLIRLGKQDFMELADIGTSRAAQKKRILVHHRSRLTALTAIETPVRPDTNIVQMWVCHPGTVTHRFAQKDSCSTLMCIS